ncbi:Tudor domain-containing protein 1 [Araneus ventricosus]|uniref:Tudor domain-containing protein 1 n=1 Tax=Araneus ventricosus TaxID=182803 RepID=A0A4Y2BDU3_ARAVE|nr:Tudor domain-containing protein 1 [Araneus ventricosus]
MKYTIHGYKKFIRANEIQKQELSLNKQYKVSVCMSCSPSNFWIHLNGSEKVLYQMEKEMTSMVHKIPVKCVVDDVCCTFENGKFRRVKLLELTPNSSIVEFIDYGGTSAVLNNKLYFLPQVFKKYPAQAIGCNLVDGVSQENVVWSDEEISSFEYHTKNKVFMGHVHGFVRNNCNIALMNEEGVSLYSILRASRMEELGIFSQAKSPVTTIPSVLSDLKEGATVTVGSVQFEEDKFWGFLENGSRTKMIKELQNCLQKVETEDISLICEEGDIAVGFSPSLSQFYRCVVLKRLRNCFLVRYIDYGNTERITKLQSLSPMLLQKKSYVICCEKPVSLSIDDMNLIFETTREVTVKSINNMVVELSFSYKNSSVVMCCYPWYHGTAIAPLIKSNSSVSSSKSSKSVESKNNIKCSQFPRKKITLDPKQDSSKSGVTQKPVITKDLVSDKRLDAALKHDVKIVWMKDASKIYVQLIADDDAIRKLLVSINKYCNSEPYSAYSPIADEIVCCKFTDGVWYRAQVTGRNKYKYKVFFIDYGNEAEVSISDIKPLPEKFTSPKLSFCVSLYGIKNEDINQGLLEKLMEEKWSMELKNPKQTPTEVMLYLRGVPLTELVRKKKNHSKTLLQFQELPAGISEVVICYAQADKIYIHQQKDLKNLLLLQTRVDSLIKTDVSKPEIGMVYCCLSGDGCWYRGLVKEILTKSIRVIYIDYGNDEEILIDNLKELSDDLFSHPVYCVPLIVQNLKLSDLKLETVFSVEVVGKKNGVQLVKVLNHPQNAKNPKISDLKRLSLGEGINEVKFSFCENDVFYCHLKNNFTDLDVLCQKLMNPELKPLNQTPTEGDLVCAKSSDGCWYRASVQSTFDKDLKLKVFFIDFGNCEDVPSENIQCLPEDVLNFPVLCVPVKIKNIEKAKNDDMNSVLSVKTVGFSDDKVQLVELVLPYEAILPKSNSLKKQSLPTDKEVDVSLCHAQGDILFVQMASSKELLTTLETRLLKASEFSDLSDLPVIGDVICAKFIDGIWYRGSVEKVFTDKKSCDICFIDYGNNEVISLENMKILPTSLCTFPVLSMPVKFKSMEKLQEKIQAGISVFPVKVIKSSDTIFVVDIVVSEDDIQLSSIESEMLPESPVEVMIVHKEADVFYVQRISNAEKLQEMMIDLQSPSFLKKLLRHPKVGELCNVKYEDGQFYRAIIKEQCGENKFKAFFVDYGNLDVVEPENIYCIPSKYSSVPGLCTAVKFNEPDNVNVLNSNPMCTIKYTGISNDNVHVVKLCPAVSRIPFSSMKQSNLDTGVQDVTFLSFDGEFHFLSRTSDSAEINEMNSILEKFEGNEMSGIPTVDEVLVIKRQNRSRCRGCIKAANETSKTCKVFLIDYGTTEEVPFSDIYYMSEKLSSFPIFCIKVILKDSTFTADSLLFEKQYSATVIGKNDDCVPIIDIFNRYMLATLIQQKLPLNELRNVIFYHKDGDILFLQDVDDLSLVAEVQAEVKKHASSDPLFRNPIVGELLCARSQADGSWYRCCVEEIVSSDKCRIRFIDYGNDEIVMRENLRSFVGELAMYPSFAIPVRIIDRECAKSTVQFEHVYSVIAESLENTVQLVKLMLQQDSQIHIPSEDIPLNDNSTNSEANEICLKPSDSEHSVVKEICTSTSSSPEVKFSYSTSDYVHFPDGEQDIIIYSVNEECSLFCAPFSPDAITANLGLTSEITQYCENLESSSFNGNSLPEVDELVLAKYDADNQWYRAVILDDSNNPFYDVIFIDYGNTERVSLDFMRKMEKNFMSLPVQTHLCSITGFTIDDKSLPNVIQELQSFGVFVNPAPLKAFVSSNGEEKSVNIPMITEHLLKKKLVTAIES